MSRPTYCSILEIDVVCLEVSVTEFWLQESAIGTRADERTGKVGGNGEDGGAGIVLTCHYEVGLEHLDEVQIWRGCVGEGLGLRDSGGWELALVVLSAIVLLHLSSSFHQERKRRASSNVDGRFIHSFRDENGGRSSR